jgi:hypothetical protein
MIGGEPDEGKGQFDSPPLAGSVTDGNREVSVWGKNLAAEKRFMNSWFTFNSM